MGSERIGPPLPEYRRNALKLRISGILCQERVQRSDCLIRGVLVSSGLLLPVLVQGKLISIPKNKASIEWMPDVD